MVDRVKDEEFQNQKAVIQWWAYAHRGYGLPEFALMAYPAGGLRTKATAGKLKAQGARAGIPDMSLPLAKGGFGGLVIELKSSVGRTSPIQREVLAWFESIGWRAVVCRSADAAMREIKAYLGARP